MASEENKEKRPLSRRRRLIFTILSIVFALVALELTFRLLDHLINQSKAARSSRMLRHEAAPGLLEWAPHVEFKPVPFYSSGPLTINKEGYRGKLLKKAKPPDTLRFICLGGSTTMMGNLTLDRTYPEILRNKIAGYMNSNHIEALNAGCDAYSTVDSLVRLSIELIDYQPDYVLIMHGINDLRSNWYKGYKSDYSHIYSWPNKFKDDSTLGWIKNKTLGICSRSVILSSLYYFLSRSSSSRNIAVTGQVEFHTINSFKRNLNSIIAITRSAGAKPVLATMKLSFTEANPPPLDSINVYYRPPNSALELYEGLKLHNKAVRELALETGTPLVDLEKSIPASSEYFEDECHYNYLGAELVAEEFFKVMVDILPESNKKD